MQAQQTGGLFDLVVIPMNSDNYCYYIHPQGDMSQGFFIDVSQAHKVTQFAKDFNLDPKGFQAIMSTHWHDDHTAGNNKMKQQCPGLRVIGGAADNCEGCTDPVNDGAKFQLFNDSLTVICHHTPCHTKGSTNYQLESGVQGPNQFTQEMKGKYMLVKGLDRCIFTGDTLFVGGCGFFMEGDANGMLYAMDRFRTLPDDMKVFGGHEYTTNNFKFLLKAEGQVNPNIEKFRKHYQSILDKGGYITPSFLGDEKKYNVFMRCREPSIQQILKSQNPAKNMHMLRQWKTKGGNAPPKY